MSGIQGQRANACCGVIPWLYTVERSLTMGHALDVHASAHTRVRERFLKFTDAIANAMVTPKLQAPHVGMIHDWCNGSRPSLNENDMLVATVAMQNMHTKDCGHDFLPIPQSYFRVRAGDERIRICCHSSDRRH